MFSPRLSRRLVRHHLPIALLTFAAGYVLYVTRPFPDVITRLSFASAYPALVLIAFTLLIGPFKVLTQERLAISMDFRRDVGIWAAMTGIFHTVIGQCVHLRGKPWLYYVYGANEKAPHLLPIRTNAFGLANFTGLFAAFVLLALLATSNDASLRKLGTPGWKQLQRWNYWSFGLIAIHTFAYQKGVEDQHAFFVLALLVVGVTVALQLIGWKRRRSLKEVPSAGAQEISAG